METLTPVGVSYRPFFTDAAVRKILGFGYDFGREPILPPILCSFLFAACVSPSSTKRFTCTKRARRRQFHSPRPQTCRRVLRLEAHNRNLRKRSLRASS